MELTEAQTTELTGAEIVWLLQGEHALHLSDLVLRRTALAITGGISGALIEAIGASPSDELVTINAWHVGAGDRVEEGDLLVEYEADKAVTELLSPYRGVVDSVLVDAGASAVFGETLEWLGAEHLLARRAATPAVAQALVGAVLRREQLARDQGVDLLGNNPGPTNIAAGLSTVPKVL